MSTVSHKIPRHLHTHLITALIFGLGLGLAVSGLLVHEGLLSVCGVMIVTLRMMYESWATSNSTSGFGAQKIFSLDAEVDGLYGAAFAVSATVRVNGVEIARFEGRIPAGAVTDSWCVDNILPAIADMPVTHQTSEELEEAFWKFWLLHRDGAIVIAHCGSPVESGLFRRCVERDVVGRQQLGPFPAIHDCATPLILLGRDGGSVDSYVAAYDLRIPFDGSCHHPTYDAIVAAVVWEHACLRLLHD